MARRFRRTLVRRLIDAGATAVIKRGLGPSQRYLLTVVGRQTGIEYTTPVSVVVDGDARFLVAAYGVVGWVRNARAAGVVTLSRGSRSERFRLAELGARDAAAVLKRYLKLEPITRPYFDISPNAPAAAFEREIAVHPVFRLTPAPS